MKKIGLLVFLGLLMIGFSVEAQVSGAHFKYKRYFWLTADGEETSFTDQVPDVFWGDNANGGQHIIVALNDGTIEYFGWSSINPPDRNGFRIIPSVFYTRGSLEMDGQETLKIQGYRASFFMNIDGRTRRYLIFTEK
jgi:hypothetical protein